MSSFFKINSWQPKSRTRSRKRGSSSWQADNRHKERLPLLNFEKSEFQINLFNFYNLSYKILFFVKLWRRNKLFRNVDLESETFGLILSSLSKYLRINLFNLNVFWDKILPLIIILVAYTKLKWMCDFPTLYKKFIAKILITIVCFLLK